MDREAVDRSGRSIARLKSPIANRLILSFLLVILFIRVAFAVVGVLLIRNRVVAEAQEMVRPYDGNTTGPPSVREVAGA